MGIQRHISTLDGISLTLDNMIKEAELAGMDILASEYRVIKELVNTRVYRMNKIVSYVDEANKRDLI